MQQLSRKERFPNVAVTLDGTVLVTWGKSGVRLRRSEDGGATWGEEITIAAPGFQGGGLTVDERRAALSLPSLRRTPPLPP